MAKRHFSRRRQNGYLSWPDLNAYTDLYPLASPQKLVNLIAMSRQGGMV